jgi:hypothetical protein
VTFSEVIEMANDSIYGLACGVFTENSSRAIRVAHALEAGIAFVSLTMSTSLLILRLTVCRLTLMVILMFKYPLEAPSSLVMVAS